MSILKTVKSMRHRHINVNILDNQSIKYVKEQISLFIFYFTETLITV